MFPSCPDSPCKTENVDPFKTAQSEEAKELKTTHKENVNSNADEEASVRLALELMRQEVNTLLRFFKLTMKTKI